jgi:tetratricopeptide (TPR) repeat protein
MKLLFSLICISLVLFIASPPVYSQDTGACTEQLEQAEKDYQMGKWDDAINLINNCLKQKEVSESEKGTAYRLLGLVYIAIQLEKEANEAVKNLLIMVPNYKIDPEKDPPQLKEIIDDVSKTLTPTLSSISPNSADEGGKQFLMTVTGTNFVNGSVVRLSGKDKTTHYINTRELKAEILQDDISKDGDYEVCVYSPISKGCSNSLNLNVKGKSSFPWTWIAVGAGAVAAGVVAIITLGGGDDDDNPPVTGLANPPTRP